MDVASTTLKFTIGLLQKHFDFPLNMVNANYMAKERGISVDVTKNADPQDISSVFSAKVVTDKGTRSVAGTVFGDSRLRIIGVDDFKVEITPEGSLLTIFNDDKPGVIGAVGNVCGKYGINIATMGVGQKLKERKAILGVSLDKEPSAEAFDELAKLDFVNEIYICKLD